MQCIGDGCGEEVGLWGRLASTPQRLAPYHRYDGKLDGRGYFSIIRYLCSAACFLASRVVVLWWHR